MSPPGDIASAAQCTGQAGCQGQCRQHDRLPGMVQVRFAAPDFTAGLVVRAEFVVPTALEPVDEVGFAKLPEASVPGFVMQLAGTFEQRLSSGAGFSMGPVQALAYHRALVPIQSVDKARRTIHRPGVLAGTGEQAFGVAHQPVRRGQLGLEARSFKVQQQPRPFETMAGGDAVGAKAIGGVVLVVSEQRLPVRIEIVR